MDNLSSPDPVQSGRRRRGSILIVVIVVVIAAFTFLQTRNQSSLDKKTKAATTKLTAALSHTTVQELRSAIVPAATDPNSFLAKYPELQGLRVTSIKDLSNGVVVRVAIEVGGVLKCISGELDETGGPKVSTTPSSVCY